jgi:histidine triad (HIT) family protein
MDNCIFCKIIRKEIPAHVVYEDESTLAFLDINPINPGHVLVIPKAHHADLLSTPDELLREVMSVARKIAQASITALNAPGFNIGVNNGAAAGQVVPHVHLHVMPRFQNDGHELWHGKPYGAGEAERAAEAIRGALA